MFEFIKSVFSKEDPAAEKRDPGCEHNGAQDLGEGLRFCGVCKTIQRMEKRKFIEPGQTAWFYRTLPKEEALAVLDDLKTRQRS